MPEARPDAARSTYAISLRLPELYWKVFSSKYPLVGLATSSIYIYALRQSFSTGGLCLNIRIAMFKMQPNIKGLLRRAQEQVSHRLY